MLEISSLEEFKDLIGEFVYAEAHGNARRRFGNDLIKFTVVKVKRKFIELRYELCKYPYISDYSFTPNGKTLEPKDGINESYTFYRTESDYQLAKQRNELADDLHAQYFGSYKNGLRSCSLEDLATIKDILDKSNR